MRKLIDPPLNRLGGLLARRGVNANAVTLSGLGVGLVAALAIAIQAYWLGLFLLLVSRLADGLDGAVARATQKTDFGGFFDIVSDFLFYGAISLGFVFADPAHNAVAGAVLLASFYFNGATFLGYAILAERQDMSSRGRGEKTLYFSAGLLEGTETIAFFVFICIWPDLFPPLALLFAAATFLTAFLRVWQAYRNFG